MIQRLAALPIAKLPVALIVGAMLAAALLVFVKSAEAVSLQIEGLNGTTLQQGLQRSFLLQIDIPDPERVPVADLTLQISGPTPVNAKFDVTGTVISKDPAIKEVVLVGAINPGSGFGFGYGYGYRAGPGFNFGYGYGYGYGQGNQFISTLRYRVVLDTSVGPMAPGSYSAKIILNTGSTPASFESSVASFTINTPPSTTTASAPIQTTITTFDAPTTQQAQSASTSITAALGKSVALQTTQFKTEKVSNQIVTTLKATGVTTGDTFTGVVKEQIGKMLIDTTNGKGTATVELGQGLKLVSSVDLQAKKDGEIAVVFNAPKLEYKPPKPTVNQLTGGSSDVTDFQATFNVDTTDVPDGATIEVTYAKDASTFQSNVGSIFTLAANAIGGTAAGTTEDVAFSVQVKTTNLAKTSLGSNAITLQVSKEWYDKRIASGKKIVITKFDDAGKAFAQEASCTPGTTLVTCTATFSGEAGGFSVFSLVAVAPVEPTPTPQPSTGAVGPAATPTPVIRQDFGQSTPGTPVAPAADASGPTTANPVTVSLTRPDGRLVLFTKREQVTTPSPVGYRLLGYEIEIDTASSTVSAPLILSFEILGSLVGGDPTAVAVFRNGVIVPQCTGAPGVAEPDPCVSARTVQANGNLSLVVLTSRASIWNFGVAQVEATATPTAAPTATARPTSTPVPPTRVPTVVPAVTPTPTRVVEATATAVPTATAAPQATPQPTATPTVAQPPTPVPPDDGGLSAGVIAIIVIALAAVVGGAAWYIVRGRRPA